MGWRTGERPWLRSCNRNCPACGCERSRRFTPPEDLHRWDTFSIVPPRECKGCGAVFLPPAPSWAIGLTALVGVGLLAAGGLLAWGSVAPDGVAGWALVGGGPAFFFGAGPPR